MLKLVPRLPDDENDVGVVTRPGSNELLLRIADGDQQAFADLYDELAPRVLGLIVKVLRDHAQSEEVTQEVFLEVWRTATRFDPNKGQAASWIMTMAHRRAIDRVRASQSGRDRDTRVGIRDYDPVYDSVSEAVEITVEHERVEVAMARLSDLQRQAVTLAY